MWWTPTAAAQGTRREPTLDRTPFYHRTHSLSSTLRLRQCTHANSLIVHISGMLEETRAPGGNPCKHGEKVQTPYNGPSPDSIFFFHPHDRETMLKEMTLFEDFLYTSLIPFRIFLSLWILHIQRQPLIFTPPAKVTSYGPWQPSALQRSGQEGRGKRTEKLKTVYLLRL